MSDTSHIGPEQPRPKKRKTNRGPRPPRKGFGLSTRLGPEENDKKPSKREQGGIDRERKATKTGAPQDTNIVLTATVGSVQVATHSCTNFRNYRSNLWFVRLTNPSGVYKIAIVLPWIEQFEIVLSKSRGRDPTIL